MGIINNPLLLEKGLRTEFVKAFNNGEDPKDVMPVIMKTESTSNQEKYGWLGESPQLREWVDERKLSGLKDYDYTLPNKDYEATLKVDRNVMEDDQLGAVKVRVRDLAARARTHPRKLFFDALIAGTTELGYDGVAFFSNSHPESGSNQDNLLGYSAAGSVPTVAEFTTGFETGRAAIRGFTDDQGEPRNEGELDLYCFASPLLENVMDQVFNATLLNNSTNTLKGAAKPIVSSRLSGLDFYLLDGSGVIKPFIHQLRQAPRFEANEKGDNAFMRKHLLYGIDYRIGFGYGAWYKAVKVVES